MAFTTTSKYAQLTSYMLMEYMYADSPTPETYPVNTGSTTVGFEKLVNGYLDDDVQIFNPTADGDAVTNNSTENNVVRIDDSNFVTLDSNLVIPFNDFDDNLTDTTDLPVSFPSNIDVVYDTVRIHIRAGYNLSDLDGVIVTISYEDQDESYVTVASILVKKGTQQVYTLNTSPVTIGSDIYDKYVEFKIPSLPDMNIKYSAASSGDKPNTLGGKISKSGGGFNTTSPIRVRVDEVISTTEQNGYDKYGTRSVGVFSLEQEDPFSDIGALIQPSDNGEFFEYFATDDGGFIEDFILFQNSIGNSYYLYHQIEVLEQIGASFIETSNFNDIQTTAYDTPRLFRPIIKNSSIANAFVLRYTVSLINNVDNTRIIRTSSYTSTSPGRYGTKITPIQIAQYPQQYKIYNKVYDQPSILLGSQANDEDVAESRDIVRYSNIFIQQHDVTTSIDNLVARSTDGVTSNLRVDTPGGERIMYGKGKGIIEISPFDNYYKFTFFTSGSDNIPNRIDLESSGDYKIVFIDNRGKKMGIPSIVDKNLANPAKGELAFKIGETYSEKILGYSNRNYYITNMPLGNRETEASAVVSSGVSNTVSDSTSVDQATSLSTRTVSNRMLKSNLVVNPQSSSVLYRGMWKKENEETQTQSATVLQSSELPTSSIPSTFESVVPGFSSSTVTRDSAVKSVMPADSSTVTSSSSFTSTTTNTTTVKLTGSALVSTVAGLIQAFDSSGWTPSQIYTYFLVPGNPGYISYPALTPALFQEAADGILSESELATLFP